MGSEEVGFLLGAYVRGLLGLEVGDLVCLTGLDVGSGVGFLLGLKVGDLLCFFVGFEVVGL